MKNLKLYESLNILTKKISKLVRTFEIEKINEQEEYKGPVIYAMNHSSANDIPLAIEYINNHFILLAGKENLDIKAKALFKMNGTIFIDRKDKADRKKSKQEMEDVLEKGHNVLIFPEGTWNLTENKIMLPLNWGIIEIAKNKNVPIIPIIQEYVDNKCILVTGKPFIVSKEDDKLDAINRLTDVFATMRWNIWESYGIYKREDVNKEDFEKYVQNRLNEYPCLDPEFESSVILNKQNEPEEVFKIIKKLSK